MITIKAGCILINKNTNKVALVVREGEYSFPKGHLEKGETIEKCAIRETIEETGHDCHLIKENEIAKIKYSNSIGENVESYFFVAIDDGITNKHIDEKDREQTVWVEFDKVGTMLSYQNLKELWEKNKDKILVNI